MKKLSQQIEILEHQIKIAKQDPNKANIYLVGVEFHNLKYLLSRLIGFTQHTWEVQLVLGKGLKSERLQIEAEHLEEAKQKAINLVDEYDSAIDFILYCDGVAVAPEKLI